MYFNIPLTNKLYINKVKNLSVMKNINYNLRYIKNNVPILLNDETILELCDSNIRDFKNDL